LQCRDLRRGICILVALGSMGVCGWRAGGGWGEGNSIFWDRARFLGFVVYKEGDWGWERGGGMGGCLYGIFFVSVFAVVELGQRFICPFRRLRKKLSVSIANFRV
jgi:hypothetical protein